MEEKYYANIADLSEIPGIILQLTMPDWFDKNDIYTDKKHIDGGYVRIVGKNIEQIKARAEVLKMQKQVRHGGGVRIKTFKR